MTNNKSNDLFFYKNPSRNQVHFKFFLVIFYS